MTGIGIFGTPYGAGSNLVDRLMAGTEDEAHGTEVSSESPLATQIGFQTESSTPSVPSSVPTGVITRRNWEPLDPSVFRGRQLPGTPR